MPEPPLDIAIYSVWEIDRLDGGKLALELHPSSGKAAVLLLLAS